MRKALCFLYDAKKDGLLRSVLRDTPQRNKSLAGFVKDPADVKCSAERRDLFHFTLRSNISLNIPTEKKNRLTFLLSTCFFDPVRIDSPHSAAVISQNDPKEHNSFPGCVF